MDPEDDEPPPLTERDKWFAGVLAFVVLLLAGAVLAFALIIKSIVENTS